MPNIKTSQGGCVRFDSRKNSFCRVDSLLTEGLSTGVVIITQSAYCISLAHCAYQNALTSSTQELNWTADPTKITLIINPHYKSKQNPMLLLQQIQQIHPNTSLQESAPKPSCSVAITSRGEIEFPNPNFTIGTEVPNAKTRRAINIVNNFSNPEQQTIDIQFDNKWAPPPLLTTHASELIQLCRQNCISTGDAARDKQIINNWLKNQSTNMQNHFNTGEYGDIAHALWVLLNSDISQMMPQTAPIANYRIIKNSLTN